jgi:hypothetical protein
VPLRIGGSGTYVQETVTRPGSSHFLLRWHLLVMSGYRQDRSDADLVLSARDDPEAFGEFYRRRAIGVERWLRTQTPGLATAADLTAETFAQALVSLDRFRASSDEQAVAWLTCSPKPGLISPVTCCRGYAPPRLHPERGRWPF